MQEIGILAEAICVGLNTGTNLLLFLELLIPVVILVMGFGGLKSLEHGLVIANDPCEVLNTHLAI